MMDKKLIKIELGAVQNGYLISAHYDNHGKVQTETYACETQASVMRRIPMLLKNIRVEEPTP